MNDQPPLIILMSAIGLYVLHLWCQDYLAAKRKGIPAPQALPGATPASSEACVIAATGAAIVVLAETCGELFLGLSEEQSEITILFGVYTLIAAFVEELIFRGFIVIEKRGNLMRWTGVFLASLLFAALHPFLWSWDMGEASAWQVLRIWNWSEWFSWELTGKGMFSTIAVFISSLWFYTVRFAPFNPHHSLLPCIVAHMTKNVGVFAIKGAQGFVIGWI